MIIKPSTFQQGILFLRNFVYKDIVTFLIVLVVLLFIGWCLMGYFLGIDDLMWQTYTGFFIIFAMVGIIYLFEDIVLMVDFTQIKEQVMSMFF